MKSSSDRTSGTKKSPKTRRVLIGVLLAVFFAGLGFFALAWRPSIAPITRPDPGSFPADLVAKGEALSAAGHCAACHTQSGGQPFVGGYALYIAFGIIFPIKSGFYSPREKGSGAGPIYNWLNREKEGRREGVGRVQSSDELR